MKCKHWSIIAKSLVWSKVSNVAQKYLDLWSVKFSYLINIRFPFSCVDAPWVCVSIFSQILIFMFYGSSNFEISSNTHFHTFTVQVFKFPIPSCFHISIKKFLFLFFTPITFFHSFYAYSRWVSHVTVKTLNIGTPRPTTVVVLNIKQFNFTMKQCLQKM